MDDSMRKPFESEVALIHEIVRKRFPADQPQWAKLLVFEESHALEQWRPSRQAFNLGFLLGFFEGGPAQMPENQVTLVAQALPGAIGSELLLSIDANTHQPLTLHLLGGGTFTTKHFAQYISRLEAAVDAALPKAAFNLRRAPYLRVCASGQYIFFLAANSVPPAKISGGKCDSHAELRFQYFERGGKIECIDGWLRYEARDSGDWRIVAMPREPKG